MYGLTFVGIGDPTWSEHKQVISAKGRQPRIIVWRVKGINSGVIIKIVCPGVLLSSGSHHGCSINPHPGIICSCPPSPSFLPLWSRKAVTTQWTSDSQRSAQCPSAQWHSLCLTHKHPDVMYSFPYRMNTWHISKLSSSSLQGRQQAEKARGCNSL